VGDLGNKGGAQPQGSGGQTTKLQKTAARNTLSTHHIIKGLDHDQSPPLGFSNNNCCYISQTNGKSHAMRPTPLNYMELATIFFVRTKQKLETGYQINHYE
jgi:hypothetical protein